MKKKRKMKVGFDAAMPLLTQGRLRNFATCESCFYFKNEDCTNTEVIPAFDMVEDEESRRRFCAYWSYTERTDF